MLAFMTAALSLAAQDSVTTCNKVGETVICRQRGGESAQPDQASLLGGPSYSEGESLRATTREAQARADAINAETQRAAKEDRAREKAGKLLAVGKCAEAEATALQGGFLDVAKAVKAYCDQ